MCVCASDRTAIAAIEIEKAGEGDGGLNIS